MTYVIQFVFAMIATIAFALLFCAPKKELVFCGLSGALGWIVYYILFQLNGNVVLASLVATFILTVFSRTMAVVRRNPATVYLLCGIFPLVPGAGIYYTAYYLIDLLDGYEILELARTGITGLTRGSSDVKFLD